MRAKVRDADLADAPALAMLLGELGYPSTDGEVSERLERMLGEPQQWVLVADVGGQVAGLATLTIRHLITQDRPLARLSALVVAAGARRAGVGRELVAAVERIAIQARADRIEVTSAERRADAHAFYVALGFEERPRRFIKRLTGG